MRLAYGGLEGLSDSDLIGFEVDDLLSASEDPTSSQNGAGASGADGDMLDWLNDPLGASDAAWEKLGLEGYEGEWDDISDSESTGSWGFMRFGVESSNGLGAAGDGGPIGGEEAEEKRRNQWEHIRFVQNFALVMLVVIPSAFMLTLGRFQSRNDHSPGGRARGSTDSEFAEAPPSSLVVWISSLARPASSSFRS